MSNRNFIRRLGNAFTQIGYGLTQTALTGIALKSMNNHCCGRSIFNFGCRGFGMMTPPYFGINISPQMMAAPMGISWFPNQMGMYAQNNNYGNMLAYQWGQQLAANSLMEIQAQIAQQKAMMQQNTLSKSNAKYAGDIDSNQEIQTGQDFNSATNAMIDKNGNAIENKSYSILDGYTDPDDKSKCADEYKSAVSNIGKSYAALIDSRGNKDQKVTADEFVDFEMSKFDSNASSEYKEIAKQMAKTAFDKIDQNGDGYADWKELASTVATFDTDIETNSASKDAEITSEQYKNWSELLSEQKQNAFDFTVRNSYKQLFGDDK